MWYRLNRAFFAWLFQRKFGFRIDGRDHEPRPPFIVIANHTSVVDIPLVANAVRRRVAFVAKIELQQHWAVRLWIRSLGGFFVRRGKVDLAAVRTGLGILRGGGVLGIFPEGTRSPDGRLRAFEEGAAYWALKAGVPILPVAIIGSYRVLPPGAKGVRPHQVLVKVGPALTVPREEGRLTSEAISRWTRRFEDALAALLPPDQQPLREAPAP